jgi:hypothetical protein
MTDKNEGVFYKDITGKAQAINYLKATGLEAGLVINLGAESLEWERVAY